VSVNHLRDCAVWGFGGTRGRPAAAAPPPPGTADPAPPPATRNQRGWAAARSPILARSAAAPHDEAPVQAGPVTQPACPAAGCGVQHLARRGLPVTGNRRPAWCRS